MKEQQLKHELSQREIKFVEMFDNEMRAIDNQKRAMIEDYRHTFLDFIERQNNY